MKSILTEETFKKSLPKSASRVVSKEVMDLVNKGMSNEEESIVFRDNLCTFTSVMKEGTYKLTSYVNAVKFVSCKMLGHGNSQAFAATFPDRYAELVANGVPTKDIAAYASVYNKTKLVVAVYGQSLVPTHIINADVYQEAINTQRDLMKTAKSEKVRSDAANSLLTHLKAPEASKVELDISIKEDETVSALRAATRAMAQEQQNGIREGRTSAAELAGAEIIDGSYKEVEDE